MIHESVRVRAPLHVAYSRWDRLEDFPQFVDNIREVRRTDDKHVHWKARLGGNDIEWDAEITQRIPDRLIEWSTGPGGPDQGGFVEFRPVAAGETEVSVHVGYPPAGIGMNSGDAADMAAKFVRDELESYKRFIESLAESTEISREPAADAIPEWRAQDSCEDE